MKRCIACGAPLWDTPLLTLDHMPAAAQHIPAADQVKEDQGLTLNLRQCTGCGLVQFDCEPVDYYRDVIRAGGFSKTMVELRHIPELIFELDTSVDYGMKIDALLSKIDIPPAED